MIKNDSKQSLTANQHRKNKRHRGE